MQRSRQCDSTVANDNCRAFIRLATGNLFYILHQKHRALIPYSLDHCANVLPSCHNLGRHIFGSRKVFRLTYSELQFKSNPDLGFMIFSSRNGHCHFSWFSVGEDSYRRRRRFLAEKKVKSNLKFHDQSEVELEKNQSASLAKSCKTNCI